jgi:hypothetical protein
MSTRHFKFHPNASAEPVLANCIGSFSLSL